MRSMGWVVEIMQGLFGHCKDLMFSESVGVTQSDLSFNRIKTRVCLLVAILSTHFWLAHRRLPGLLPPLSLYPNKHTQENGGYLSRGKEQLKKEELHVRTLGSPVKKLVCYGEIYQSVSSTFYVQLLLIVLLSHA